MLLQGVRVSQHGTVRVRKGEAGEDYELNEDDPQLMMMLSKEAAENLQKQQPPPGKIVNPAQMFGGPRNANNSPRRAKQPEKRGEGNSKKGSTFDNKEKRSLMTEIKNEMKPMVQ